MVISVAPMMLGNVGLEVPLYIVFIVSDIKDMRDSRHNRLVQRCMETN